MGFEDEVNNNVKAMVAKGYRTVTLLFEIAGSIYEGLAFVHKDKSLEDWHPYKGHRDLQDFDAWVVGWEFDQELSAQNNAGELIYIASLGDDEDDEGTEPQEVNCEKYEEVEPENFFEYLPEVGPNGQQAILKRLNGIVNGTEDRWDDAPRFDKLEDLDA
jgi:hypothetical protein